MRYLDNIAVQLEDMFGSLPNIDELIEFVKAELIESYKNGMQAERRRRMRRPFAKDNNKAPR